MLHDRRITHARWLHSTHSEKQAREVIERFQLEQSIRRFVRCPACNGLVEAAEKAAILDQLEPLTKKYYSKFFQCGECRKIYWKGSHYARIVDKLDAIVQSRHR